MIYKLQKQVWKFHEVHKNVKKKKYSMWIQSKKKFKVGNTLAELSELSCRWYFSYLWADSRLYISGWYLGLSDGHTSPSHSLNSLKLIHPCPIVALNKAVGNVSLDCTCFLLPCIFIKSPDAAAGAPPFHNVRKDCKGKHMWPTSSHQIK